MKHYPEKITQHHYPHWQCLWWRIENQLSKWVLCFKWPKWGL